MPDHWQPYALVSAMLLAIAFFRPLAERWIGRPLERMALEREPDTLTLVPQVLPRWQDERQRLHIADQMREAGFLLAGWFDVSELPHVRLALFANEEARAHAFAYEHATLGRWSEFMSSYEDGSAFVCAGHPSLGLGARTGVRRVHHPGLDAGEMWTRMQQERPPGGLEAVDVDGSEAHFLDVYAADVAFRKGSAPNRPRSTRARTSRAA